MEIPVTTGDATVEVVFKIDLIVWKYGSLILSRILTPQFKIDLIVWK